MGPVEAQVLGGPLTLMEGFDRIELFTTKWIEHPDRAGRTFLARRAFLWLMRYSGHQPIDSSDIIYADCPECEEPESIFYAGDYICAWCREMMEQ
jgi:hypothetical protein